MNHKEILPSARTKCYNPTMAKNKAAAELGRARWKRASTAERQEHARMMNEARWSKTTKEERSEAARKAVTARWAKAKKKKPA